MSSCYPSFDVVQNSEEEESMAHGMDQEYDYLFKMVVIEDSGIGESNILSQFYTQWSSLLTGIYSVAFDIKSQ